jgi:hypothetical protein
MALPRFGAALLPTAAHAGTKLNGVTKSLSTIEPVTPFEAITGYNNYYESRYRQRRSRQERAAVRNIAVDADHGW